VTVGVVAGLTIIVLGVVFYIVRKGRKDREQDDYGI